MPCKKKKVVQHVHSSPAQKSAKAVSNKYKLKGKRMSPRKTMAVRRALYSVCNESMSLRKAARECNLSYSFLQRRYSGETDIDKVKGPATIFTKEEEENMASWLSEMAQRGMGLRTCEFLDFVQDVVKREKRKTPFTDGRPGYSWYIAFMNRNSNLHRHSHRNST
ncbi:hypothetical protein DPMN_122151 [Dreissena polymorpha]|uniref:HTH psq-type domain-containing protein n=1 Tax=Dreissena polymorpha TaxID=45954 RepID=A0A9D4GNU6_DREPO|nr:hypothetical protein DPMN_122151 [Dreissena polymorpha]